MEKLSREEKTIFVYAVRYSMGRHLTGSLTDCIGYFNKHKKSFQEWELKVILEDLNYQINMNQQVKTEFICNANLIGLRSIVCGLLQEMEDGDGRFCR